jgi:hypothetical protein
MTTTRLPNLIGFMAIPIRVKVYGIVYGQPLSVSTSLGRAWQEKVMARKKFSRNAPSPDERRQLQNESHCPQHLFGGRVPIHWIPLLHRLPRCVEIEQTLFALYTFQYFPLSKLLVNRVLPAVSPNGMSFAKE